MLHIHIYAPAPHAKKAKANENFFFFFHVSCSVFSAQLSHKGSFMCREGGMEKKTFPFELTDLQ